MEPPVKMGKSCGQISALGTYTRRDQTQEIQAATMPDRERILTLRELGWTQTANAAEVGLSRSRVQQLLTRGRTPERLEELRARITARATGLRADGVYPWAS